MNMPPPTDLSTPMLFPHVSWTISHSEVDEWTGDEC